MAGHRVEKPPIPVDEKERISELHELRLSIIYRSQPIELLFTHERIVARLTDRLT